MSSWAIAAIFTGIAGVIAAYAGLVKTRHEGNRECEQRLARARAEAETLAGELHDLRMRS